MIIWAAVIHNNFKKIYANIAKNHLQYLATPTSITTNFMALKVFAETNFSDYKDNLLKHFLLDQNWQNKEQSFE